jgi:prevent-host-death family protein
MTIHVNIGEAKTRLSELVAAAVRGEEVVLSKAGEPQVRLVAVPKTPEAEELERRRQRRLSAFGMWKEIVPTDFEVPRSMTDEELEERWHRKGYGPSA